MTQPAKVQEPSMEEILASIRRIIADDEAKPAAAEKPPEPCAAGQAGRTRGTGHRGEGARDERHSAVGHSSRASAAAKAARRGQHRRRRLPAAPAASNSQDDIDALLNGLDEATTPKEIRPPAPDGEVFELTDEMAVRSRIRRSLRSTRSNRQTISNLPKPRGQGGAPAALRSNHRRLKAPRCPPPQQILSRSTVSAVESAFNTLAHTVLSNNARTLEDLVKEMLRPMLKSWLDDNLPGLVERIVKAEIERVSRGR